MSDQGDQEDEGTVSTIPFDPRFPNQNQTKNCYFSYVDYHKCANLYNNPDEAVCSYFKRAFTVMCPNAWVEKWDEQRENGTFPRSLEVGKK